MDFQHLVQTRFSVRARWGYQEFPLEWLEGRLALFDAYCLPSLAAQSCDNFLWLVYCDASTSASVKEQLRERSGRVPQLRIVETGSVPILRATAPFIGNGRALITTRIDSDDAMHSGYIAAIQAHVKSFLAGGDQTWLLNFPRGFKLDHRAGILYFDWNPRSHFHTLFERDPQAAKTVIASSHSRLHEEHPNDQDDSLAAWIQVIHGGNVINALRKHWAPEARLDRLSDFGIQLAPEAYPGRAVT